MSQLIDDIDWRETGLCVCQGKGCPPPAQCHYRRKQERQARKARKKLAKLNEQRQPMPKHSPRQVIREALLAKIKREKIEQFGLVCQAPHEAMERLGYVTCRQYELIDLHHIDQRSHVTLDTDENTMLLRRTCHNFCKEHPRDAARLGLVKSNKWDFEPELLRAA